MEYRLFDSLRECPAELLAESLVDEARAEFVGLRVLYVSLASISKILR